MTLMLLIPFYFALTLPTALANIRANILVYTATAGFRHDSIPTAVSVLQNNSDVLNANVQHTEDMSLFNDNDLSLYDAIIFLSTTGEVLDVDGKSAFQSWLDKGENFVGIHSASDCLNTTSFYGKELGAFFDYHPELQNATIDIVGPAHPSTSGLPKRWNIADEMYNFKSDPRAVGAIVVLSADETSYKDTGPKKFDQGHPTAWYQDHGAGVQEGGTAGRSFYTSLGHLNETWEDKTFMSHVLGGISWALASNTTRAFNSSGLVGATNSNSEGSSGSSGTGSSGSDGSSNARTTARTPSTLIHGLLALAFVVYIRLA